jgi:hypothetical protein
MRGLMILAVGFAMSIAGCSGRPDYKQIADDWVQVQYLDKFEKREAIPYFEGHGRLFDADSSTTVDRDVVLPLLKRLAEVAPTEQWVLLKPETTDTAVVLLVELPKDVATVDRMAQVVQDADDSFSGFIIQQWGYQWLGMNLVDQTAYEFLKKADPDVDKQR